MPLLNVSFLESALARLGKEEEVHGDAERDGGAAEEGGHEAQRVFVPARTGRLGHLRQSPNGLRGRLLPPLVLFGRGHQRLKDGWHRERRLSECGTLATGDKRFKFIPEIGTANYQSTYLGEHVARRYVGPPLRGG